MLGKCNLHALYLSTRRCTSNLQHTRSRLAGAERRRAWRSKAARFVVTTLRQKTELTPFPLRAIWYGRKNPILKGDGVENVGSTLFFFHVTGFLPRPC